LKSEKPIEGKLKGETGNLPDKSKAFSDPKARLQMPFYAFT